MRITLNLAQRRSLSTFFNNIAVAWFGAAFITPSIELSFNPLTIIKFLVNMIAALYLSLVFLEDEL